ncbi:MAG: RNA polymerase sigma factor [Bacteroidales bacterium]|jgi:RNA polymerase sigma-70 factor (ECF subfamily)|nr:RNA polymerase sigma factor [Bacteroidales bacterium]
MTREEFNKCADMYSDFVFRFVLKNISDYTSAEDIVQDSYEKMWLRHENIDFQKAKSYLFACAYSTMIDFLRKNHSKISTPIETGLNIAQESFPQFDGIKEALEFALKKLPAEQRSVIILRDYEGYSYEEISKITSLSLSAVKVYIFRGRVAMKNMLEKSGVTVTEF